MASNTDPESPLPHATASMHTYMDDMLQKHLAGAEQITVEVSVLRETWESILDFIRAREWKQDEGVISLLVAGMLFLDSEAPAEATESEIIKLRRHVIDLESQYAAVRFFASTLLTNYKRMEMRQLPLERNFTAYYQFAERLRAENESLKSENQRLKRQAGEYSEMMAVKRPSWTHRLHLIWEVMHGKIT